jgi:hypothetical protein
MDREMSSYDCLFVIFVWFLGIGTFTGVACLLYAIL